MLAQGPHLRGMPARGMGALGGRVPTDGERSPRRAGYVSSLPSQRAGWLARSGARLLWDLMPERSERMNILGRAVRFADPGCAEPRHHRVDQGRIGVEELHLDLAKGLDGGVARPD